MDEYKKDDKGFVAYEYSEVTVSQSMESVYVDGYQNFGWELEGSSVPVGGVYSVNLKFKRDRKYHRTAEITRLMRQFDSCASEIVAMERSKGIGASTQQHISSVFLEQTACMAGAVFAYLGGLLPLMIILAIPGLAGWVIPYFCYVAIRKKKCDQLDPLIDKKYDEIYTVCEKANGLLTTI